MCPLYLSLVPTRLPKGQRGNSPGTFLPAIFERMEGNGKEGKENEDERKRSKIDDHSQ